MKKLYPYFASLLLVAMFAKFVFAAVVPAFGLYWQLGSDPTAAGGLSAPLNQLLIRTDTPAIYYKSGTLNTNWTLLGTSAALTGVSHDTTLTGNGTVGTPLGTDPTIVQNRVSGSCTAGNAIRVIAQDGTVTCQTTGTSPSIISPAALGATTNDYNPTGLSTATDIRQDASTLATLTGLTAQNNGTRITLHNISDTQANEIILSHQDAASSAANRFILPSDLSWRIPRNGSVQLFYDNTTQRWRMTAYSGNVMPVGTSVNPGLVVGATVDRGFFDGGATLSYVNTGGSTVFALGNSASVTGAFSQTSGTFSATTGTSTLTLSGPTIIDNRILFTGSSSPAVLNASVNDYSISNTVETIRQDTGAAGVNITGMNNGADGRIVTFTNITTTLANTLTFTHQDGASTAANRFILPGATSLVLSSGGSVTFRYDGTSSRWRVIDR